MATNRTIPLAGFLILALAGCSQLAPTEAAPTTTGTSGTTNVGVCYSSAASTPAQVTALATDECPVGMKARLVSQEWNLDACPVLTPVQATFACAAP